jgi:deoxyribodipyrimidine photo-lyase
MYLPELAKVNSDVIHEPWKMSLEEEPDAAVSIGLDYPSPIVDHEAARKQNWNSTRRAERVDRPWPK